MSPDIARQLQGLCQAVLLGGAMGLVYDGMRVLRRSFSRAPVDAALDLLFWILATAALFRFSQRAWAGQIRLYGAVFCMLGGAAYFWGVSPLLLPPALLLARIVRKFLGLLSLPARLAARLFKRFEKNAKYIFSFLRK